MTRLRAESLNYVPTYSGMDDIAEIENSWLTRKRISQSWEWDQLEIQGSQSPEWTDAAL